VIFSAFLASLGQIDDRNFRAVLLRALGLTIGLLALFVYAVALGLGWLIPDEVTLPVLGKVTFLDELGTGIGLVSGLILSVFLMVPVASVFVGLFLDQIARAVEEKHYPHLPQAPGAGLAASVGDALRFLGVVILVNLAALLVYLIFAPLAPLIFWAVNGLLLGREYFQMVALRRLSRPEADALRRKNRVTIFAAGVLMTIPLSIPILNLIIPILGVATFTHLFHRLTAR